MADRVWFIAVAIAVVVTSTVDKTRLRKGLGKPSVGLQLKWKGTYTS